MPRVTIFSATTRAALALARVVVILVFSMIPPLLAGLLWASPAEPPPNTNGLLVWSIEQSAGEDSAKFVAALTANEPWMREFLDSGPVRDAPRSLAFLQSIWTDDPDLGKRPIDRSMATACALEIGQRGRDEANMRLIFDFYRPRNPNADDAKQLRLGRYLTLVLGLIGTATALVMASVDVKFVFDGEEEGGSPNLGTILQANTELFASLAPAVKKISWASTPRQSAT